MGKNIVVPIKHKSKKWESPKVIKDNPIEDRKYRDFIEATEGRENKGGQIIVQTRTSLTEKELKRQNEAMKRLKERGWQYDGD